MKYRPLGLTGIEVSLICLGSMTWGSQNSEAEAHQQLDYAFDHGVNFIDTAEAYPVTPSTPENRGSTEEYIGSWLARVDRSRAILATKVAGPTRGAGAWSIRGGENKLDRANIRLAVEGSLKRLRTDYIDLYQLHWPDRTTAIFGQRGVKKLADRDDVVPIAETLAALEELIKEGKIRSFGLSNETPWGVSEFLRLSREQNLPRAASIQNAYSLLNRTFESGLSEFALREHVGLLAYSPLAAGHLTGKYLGGAIPAGSRLDVAKQFRRYNVPQQPSATERYVGLARAHGIDPAQLALAFINAQPFVTANIIGATSLAQLETNIGSIGITLDNGLFEAIDAIQREIPDPCP